MKDKLVLVLIGSLFQTLWNTCILESNLPSQKFEVSGNSSPANVSSLTYIITLCT